MRSRPVVSFHSSGVVPLRNSSLVSPPERESVVQSEDCSSCVRAGGLPQRVQRVRRGAIGSFCGAAQSRRPQGRRGGPARCPDRRGTSPGVPRSSPGPGGPAGLGRPCPWLAGRTARVDRPGGSWPGPRPWQRAGRSGAPRRAVPRPRRRGPRRGRPWVRLPRGVTEPRTGDEERRLHTGRHLRELSGSGQGAVRNDRHGVGGPHISRLLGLSDDPGHSSAPFRWQTGRQEHAPAVGRAQ